MIHILSPRVATQQSYQAPEGSAGSFSQSKWPQKHSYYPKGQPRMSQESGKLDSEFKAHDQLVREQNRKLEGLTEKVESLMENFQTMLQNGPGYDLPSNSTRYPYHGYPQPPVIQPVTFMPVMPMGWPNAPNMGQYFNQNMGYQEPYHESRQINRAAGYSEMQSQMSPPKHNQWKQKQQYSKNQDWPAQSSSKITEVERQGFNSPAQHYNSASVPNLTAAGRRSSAKLSVQKTQEALRNPLNKEVKMPVHEEPVSKPSHLEATSSYAAFNRNLRQAVEDPKYGRVLDFLSEPEHINRFGELTRDNKQRLVAKVVDLIGYKVEAYVETCIPWVQRLILDRGFDVNSAQELLGSVNLVLSADKKRKGYQNRIVTDLQDLSSQLKGFISNSSGQR